MREGFIFSIGYGLSETLEGTESMIPMGQSDSAQGHEKTSISDYIEGHGLMMEGEILQRKHIEAIFQWLSKGCG